MARLWGREAAKYTHDLLRKEGKDRLPMPGRADHLVSSGHNYIVEKISKLDPSTIAAVARAARQA